MSHLVTERAHDQTRFFSGTVEQFNRIWENFTHDRTEALLLGRAEATAKAAELNKRHSEHSSWCAYGVVKE